MIVFYTETKNVSSRTSVKTLQKTSTCSSSCASNCIKPKSKCCNKYQKKGINCKRCPLTFDLKAVS